MNQQVTTEARDLTPETLSELPMVRPRSARTEDAEAYRVTVDLPGVSRDDAEVRYEDGILAVEAVTRREPGASLQHVEFGPRRFRTSFRLGEAVDAEGIRARFEHGQLTITLPKRAETKPRAVPIEG